MSTEVEKYHRWLLGNVNKRREAVALLMRRPEARLGEPPEELIRALRRYVRDADGGILALARAWERGPLCRALLERFGKVRYPQMRESYAELIAHLGALGSWEEIVEIAGRQFETIQIRRLMLGALAEIAEEGLPWTAVEGLFEGICAHSSPRLREAVIPALSVYCRQEAAQTQGRPLVLLCGLLEDSNPWVLVRALEVARTEGFEDVLPEGLLEKLREHPHPLIQESWKVA